jgi:arylsulfatase A-like enzyme
MALVLNLWVFKEGKRPSEIFAAQINHNTDNRLTNLNDKNINVILISIDSLRADHLSCYGYHRKTSPNIDRLASEGVVFSNAFSITSWTLPAHMSMLTSMYSESHGVITDEDYLDENRITLAEVLKKEGYATTAFISGAYLHSRYGFNQGFDLYDDFTINEAARVGEVTPSVTSPRLNEAIQSWLRKNYQKKFFLFLHYFDVHYDYVPSPPYDTIFDPNYKGTIDARNFHHNPAINPEMSPRDLNHIISLYDGEIAFTDKYIGEVLSALVELGIFDNTLIILTADHGDEFFEHGRKGHKRSLYEEVLHVPLIFKFPSNSNLVGNRKIEEVVSIIDIMPTILDYLGVKSHEEMQGQSLLPLLNGNKKSNDVLIYSRLEYKLVAVRSANSKLIHDLRKPRKELYDLVNDSREKINLFDEGTSVNIAEGEKYIISLLNWLNTQTQFYQALPRTGTKKKIELSEPVKEQLKALGYIQ